MRIILTFVANAGLNLVLGLALAALLGPANYGRFAVGSTVSVVVALALFDWLRLSVTRFYGETARTTEPALRATFNGAYALLSALLAGAVLLALALRLDFGLGPALLAAAAFGGASNGLFDFYAALARARFLDRSYLVLVLVKNALALGLGLGAAFLTSDPALVVAATSAAAVLALLPVHAGLRDANASARLASTARLRGFAAYGMPVVAANVIFQLIVLMNRSTAAATLGFADAGLLSLATDLGLRLLLAVGSAVDVLVFQLAVRRDAEHGREAAAEQLQRNGVIVVAVMTLLCVGYALALPAFTAVLVPAPYRAGFGHASLALLPGLYLFCIGQFALSPNLQLAGRTRPVLAAAGLALVADGLGLALVPHGAGVPGLAAVHAGSLGTGFLALLVLARRAGARLPSRADLARIALAGVLTATVMWPLRSLAPAWLALGTATVAGTAVFGLTVLAFDLAGARRALVSRLGPLRRIRAALP